MNTLDKVWVHLRFFLKFVSLQLFSFLLTFYGALLLFVMWLFFNFSLLFVIITLLAIPLAIIEEKYVKTRLLWFIRDDTRLDKSRGSGFAEDFDTFLNGKEPNFFKLYQWYNRNKCWNLKVFFDGDDGNEYLVELIENKLILNGQPIALSDNVGYMRYENVAGLKWINKNGDEGFQVFSGYTISINYSIFGKAKLYYRIGTKFYYRYSYCDTLQGFWLWFWRVALIFAFKWTFSKTLWITKKYNSNQGLGTLHFKIQYEK